MVHEIVDLKDEDTGVLFSADGEARSSGWAVEEPYPKLLKLMEAGSVQKGSLEELMGLPPQFSRMWEDVPAYTIFGFDAVDDAFRDSETFTNEVYDRMSKHSLGDTLLNMDGSRHRRMRNVTKPYFKPSFTETWWNDRWIVQAVDELFDRITKNEQVDLNMALCAPLPMSVVSIGFGLSSRQVLPIRKALHRSMAHDGSEDKAAAEKEVAGTLYELIAQRRSEPRDDLISKMVHADLELEEGGTRKLADDEILRYCQLIVHAGGGTTWRQLGITIMALLNHPDQLHDLRQDRSLLRPAIQEATRWYPTDPVFLRWVAKDTALEGVEIKAGSIAYLCLASANRDRKRWDNPDVFDIHRPVKRHFAFGAGPHACLGQHLSRQEMEVALNAVLDRMPNLRWDPDQPPPRMSGGTLLGRGPDALPVRFGPRA